MLQFSDTSGNTGMVQQVRSILRVDATQWPTYKIMNSANNWLNTLTGYAIGADKRFQFDSTNHSKLPEGTTDLVTNQVDYSFLTDEQGNKIITLTGISLIDSNSKETPLILVDRNDIDYDISTYGKTSGTPTKYDKIADNIIRLDRKASATDVSTYDLKFYFQRTPYYYIVTDTTRETGFSPLLDRGFIVAAAYDGALTLGLANSQVLGVERQIEKQQMIAYFARRNNDDPKPVMTMRKIQYI